MYVIAIKIGYCVITRAVLGFSGWCIVWYLTLVVIVLLNIIWVVGVMYLFKHMYGSDQNHGGRTVSSNMTQSGQVGSFLKKVCFVGW